MKTWLRTEEALEAVISLEMLCEHLPRVIDEPHYWKWVIIALHNALQGFMVLALKGNNGLNVLTKECEKEWIAAFERGDEVLPERKLDNFLNLYKKIKSGRKTYEEHMSTGGLLHRKPTDRMLMYTVSKPFMPHGTLGQSVKMLHELRNEFIHFLPKGWSLEVSGLPQVVKDCVTIIDFLAFECGNVIWHDEEREAETKELVKKAMAQVDILANSYKTGARPI